MKAPAYFVTVDICCSVTIEVRKPSRAAAERKALEMALGFIGAAPGKLEDGKALIVKAVCHEA